MKSLRKILNTAVFGIYILPVICLSAACQTGDQFKEEALTGSTDCNEPLKVILGIAPETNVDFIRWDLVLEEQVDHKNFELNITYGESQPNTLGFKAGGTTRTIRGKYIIYQEKKIKTEVYRLTSDSLRAALSLIKLNSNIFHLLTNDNQLMVGSGGWSYTLNRKQVIPNDSVLPELVDFALFDEDTVRRAIFTGRTPCQEISSEYSLNVIPDCFKLKWKLILFRDSNFQPSTYLLSRTDHRASDIGGKWTLIKGIGDYPGAVIYRLDPDQPDKSVSLVAGDNNVLFFLNRKNQLYVGNKDFSYTLNRSKPIISKSHTHETLQ